MARPPTFSFLPPPRKTHTEISRSRTRVSLFHSFIPFSGTYSFPPRLVPSGIPICQLRVSLLHGPPYRPSHTFPPLFTPADRFVVPFLSFNDLHRSVHLISSYLVLSFWTLVLDRAKLILNSFRARRRQNRQKGKEKGTHTCDARVSHRRISTLSFNISPDLSSSPPLIAYKPT